MRAAGVTPAADSANIGPSGLGPAQWPPIGWPNAIRWLAIGSGRKALGRGARSRQTSRVVGLDAAATAFLFLPPDPTNHVEQLTVVSLFILIRSACRLLSAVCVNIESIDHVSAQSATPHLWPVISGDAFHPPPDPGVVSSSDHPLDSISTRAEAQSGFHHRFSFNGPLTKVRRSSAETGPHGRLLHPPAPPPLLGRFHGRRLLS